MTAHPDKLTLGINGRTYAGWEMARVTRGIGRLATDFMVQVARDRAWRIDVFDTCTLAIDDETILTGYVEEVAPQIHPVIHTVQIAGRSKVADLLDCAQDVPGGQFAGYSLAAIARAFAGTYGIAVVDQSDGLADATFADATVQRGETDFAFLQRLGNLSGVLLTDNAAGNLVLATVGTARAAGRLAEGENIGAATARLSGRHRYSEYIVKGQHALGAGPSQDYSGAGGITTPAAAPAVQTQMRAVAYDKGVPRFRPRVVLAESMLTGAGLQLRANWIAQVNVGRATQAEVTVAGWRQPDGSLWQVNQIVPVDAPALGVQQDLLVVQTEFALSAYEGRQTRLHLAPIEAYTPDPGSVKLHRKRGAGTGGAAVWTGAGGKP